MKAQVTCWNLAGLWCSWYPSHRQGLPTLFRKFYCYMASETTIVGSLATSRMISKFLRGAATQYRHVLETLSNSVFDHSAQSHKNIISPEALQPTPYVNVFVVLPISICYKQIDNLPSAGWLPFIGNVRYSKAYKIYLYTRCIYGHVTIKFSEKCRQPIDSTGSIRVYV